LGCDIIVAVGKATLDGTVIFGKNSDRRPNESQPLVYHPQLHHKEKTIGCQNIEIPQVPVTYGHIGSRPYWLWGYEQGVNEFGVAIGNAAASGSKDGFEEPADKAGLIGMDLVRLGLERGKTAHEAMLTMTSLLGQYGAGYCENPFEAKYHNSYILADPNEAWILETSGRYWVAKRIVDGIYHQGNHYTIQSDWDECHPDLISHAVEMGWCDSEKDFNFVRVYWDYSRSPITGSMVRYRRGKQLLEKYAGEVVSEIIMEIMRDHLDDTFLESFWAPGENFYNSLCFHERPWTGG
jgi:secernin